MLMTSVLAACDGGSATAPADAAKSKEGEATPVVAPAASPTPSYPETFPTVCDVSAALAAPDGGWIVATDENNELVRISADGSASPIAPDLSELFEAAGEQLPVDKEGQTKEIDIEAVATLVDGDRTVAFWIGSHSGRKAKKKPKKKSKKLRKPEAQPARRFLFATNVPPEGRALELYGTPSSALGAELDAPANDKLAALIDLPAYPNAGGINIEGLAVDGGTLLIGFRSPVSGSLGHRALVVRLDNPLGVVLREEEPALSDVAWLDLGTRGIRSFEWAAGQNAYIILAGPVDYQDVTRDALTNREYPQFDGYASDFALYRWTGFGANDGGPKLSLLFGDANTNLRPEATVVTETGVLLISDDGKVVRNSDAQDGQRTCGDRLKNVSSDDASVFARARHIELPSPGS